MKQGEPAGPAVELRRIHKRFGQRVILDGIDLTIGRGEVVVLVGPSGSGKSTLLKMVSGIETPDEGEVWLSGQIATTTPPYRRPVHTIFQNYALFPHLDVAGNVGFPLAVAGVSRQERMRLVDQALGWVKMQPHARRRVDTLSGGERQRVALARALVDQPQCVLLDEPLSALDPHLRAATLELLQDLQSRLSLTYLYITHDREEALRIGHRIGVLNHGRLEQLGSPEEVYQRPRTPFVASFLGRINWLGGEIVAEGSGQQLFISGRPVPLPGPMSIAGKVQLGIRPEDLQVSNDGWIAAKVVSRQFSGDSTSLRLKLESGEMVLVDERPPSPAQVGETVKLRWDPQAAHVFPAAEETRP